MAIHQHHVTSALRHLIGKFCHIYLDDIVIWLQNLEEHERNVRKVLKALLDAWLYVNPEKMHLFCVEIDFLGPHISLCDIKADNKRADKIINWPIPKSVTEA